jgi:ABC-type polysaccharide/polyol phosphate export permease
MSFLLDILRKRYLLKELSKRDFTQKYVDSYLGLIWAILEPLATTIILSVIFTFGFKAGLVQDVPFFIYMLSGMVAYNFFSMSVGEGTQVIRAYSYLVKKVDFRLSILPVMKVISAGIFHSIMLMILIVSLLIYGIKPSFYWLQLPYYILCTVVLVLGITWLTSSVSVFIPDIGNIISIGLQFLFYLSPIFWGVSNLPAWVVPYLKLNPMFYVIQGYRDSLIFHKGFWEYPLETLYFWGVSSLILFFGVYVFRKLKPQFADVI